MSPRQRAPTEPSELRLLRESAGLSQSDLAAATGFTAKTIYRWEIGGRPRKAVLEFLRGRLLLAGESHRSDGRFRFIDLFAGIGGMRLGFESIGGQCAFTSEWNRYAQQTYRDNFGELHPIAGDIVQIPTALIPSHDVLLAGFPCQPFSIAGVSKKNSLGRPHGFACEAQGTMFFELARILRDHRPRAFLLENVKNLATHDRGRTFETIKRVLIDELGYNVSWRVLDARSVVPQHRDRIFIVGFSEFNSFSFDEVELPPTQEGPRLRSVLHPEDGSEPPERPYTEEDGRVASRYTLSSHLWKYLREYAEKHRHQGNGFGYGLVGPDDVARTLSARYFKDGSEILVRRGRGNPRRLTPRECARLMGFDRAGRKPFVIPVSDTQAYKQFGNAVVVPVVEAVARAMRPYILGEVARPQQFVLPLEARRA